MLDRYHAIIDLDDTLADMRTPLMGIFNAYTGRDTHWSNWKSLTAEEVYGISQEEFFEVCIREKLVEKMKPHEEARRFLQVLKERDIVTTILTARTWFEDSHNFTSNWFKDHDLHFDNLVVCSVADNKYDYIPSHQKVLLTVDDSVRHCNGYNSMEENRPEFVFGYGLPWNKDKFNEGVITIESLAEIGNHIEGLKLD